MIESIRARAITYELDFDAERMSHIKPKMSIISDAKTALCKELEITKGKPVFDKDLLIKRKERGEITIEVWDEGMPEAGTFLARGHYKFHNLRSHEGTFNEWITLKDEEGKKVGSVLIEITVLPQSCDLQEESAKDLIQSLDANTKKEFGLNGDQNTKLDF